MPEAKDDTDTPEEQGDTVKSEEKGDTVKPEKKDKKKIIYQAQSPDENALVSAARTFGFAFEVRFSNL